MNLPSQTPGNETQQGPPQYRHLFHLTLSGLRCHPEVKKQKCNKELNVLKVLRNEKRYFLKGIFNKRKVYLKREGSGRNGKRASVKTFEAIPTYTSVHATLLHVGLKIFSM